MKNFCLFFAAILFFAFTIQCNHPKIDSRKLWRCVCEDDIAVSIRPWSGDSAEVRLFKDRKLIKVNNPDARCWVEDTVLLSSTQHLVDASYYKINPLTETSAKETQKVYLNIKSDSLFMCQIFYQSIKFLHEPKLNSIVHGDISFRKYLTPSADRYLLHSDNTGINVSWIRYLEDQQKGIYFTSGEIWFGDRNEPGKHFEGEKTWSFKYEDKLTYIPPFKYYAVPDHFSPKITPDERLALIKFERGLYYFEK